LPGSRNEVSMRGEEQSRLSLSSYALHDRAFTQEMSREWPPTNDRGTEGGWRRCGAPPGWTCSSGKQSPRLFSDLPHCVRTGLPLREHASSRARRIRKRSGGSFSRRHRQRSHVQHRPEPAESRLQCSRAEPEMGRRHQLHLDP
jgi:hypothetical protein